MFRTLLLTVIVAASFTTSIPTGAFAQSSSIPHSAQWKVLGKDPPGWNDHQGVSRRAYHAADYANDLRGYLQQHTKPSAKVAKELVAEVGHNLDAAKKHLDAMKHAAGNDKEQLAGIAKIEKHLDEAFAQHKQLHAACAVENFDAAKAMTCCNDLVKALDKFHAEHAELMKSIAKKTGAKPVQ